MRPPLPATIAAAVLAGLAVAGLRAADTAPAERAGRLRIDRLLITAVVDSGLKLAAEDDPLKRAQTCNALAGTFAEEARRAAAARERDRAADLGQCLQSVLVRGVAANLSLARGELSDDSPRMPEMRRVSERAVALTGPLLEDMERTSEQDSPPMRAAVRALSRARAQVERAVKDKERGGGRDK
jgi:hypothetical protein